MARLQILFFLALFAFIAQISHAYAAKPLHYATTKIFETSHYRVHEFHLSDEDKIGPCGRNGDRLEVSIIITDHDFSVSPESIAEIFRMSLLPYQKKTCPKATQINARFFFDNVYFLPDGSEVPADKTAGNELWYVSAIYGLTKYSSGEPYLEYLLGVDRLTAQEGFSNSDYHTLAGFRALRDRNYMTKKDASDLTEEAGFLVKYVPVRTLLLGKDHLKYFEENKEYIPRIIIGYAYAVTKNCIKEQDKIPGGIMIDGYKTTNTKYKDFTKTEIVSQTVSEEYYLFPTDFSKFAQDLVETTPHDYVIEKAYKRAESTLDYELVKQLIDTQGCGSPALVKYHENLKQVAGLPNAWNNREAIAKFVTDLLYP